MLKQLFGGFLIVGALLVAKPAFAQDYKPVVVQVTGQQVAAAACYTMTPMQAEPATVAARRFTVNSTIFLPWAGTGGPMCINPADWRSVVGLQGDMEMVPAMTNGVGELNATNLPHVMVAYTLTKDLAWMNGPALPTTVSGYRHFRMMVIKNDRNRVDAAMIDPASLPEPALWAERAIVIDESIKRKGEYHTRIELSTATPVRPLPELLWPPVPIIEHCPLVGAYVPITQIGAEPKFDGVHLTSWLHIQYDPATLIRCPNLRNQEWIELADFWPQLDKGVQYALDTMWRLSGRRYKGPVAFVNERTGEILITTGVAIPLTWGVAHVTVIVADAIGPYVWLLIPAL